MTETHDGAPRLSIVIPCFNEQARLAAAVGAVVEFAALREIEPIELLLVDDSSTDHTADIAHDIASGDPRVRVVVPSRGKGKGAAVRAGVLAARGEAVLVTDADLAADLEVLPRMWRMIRDDEADAVIASRLIDGAVITTPRPLRRRLPAAAFRCLVRSTTRLRATDPQCGLKMFARQRCSFAFEQCHIDGYAYEIDVLLRLSDARCRVAEVPVRWTERPSDLRVLRAGARMCRDVVSIRRSSRAR